MESKEATTEAKIALHNTENNVEENVCIRLMRDIVEKKDPTSKEVDDLVIRRFLRARGLNVEKASGLFLNYLQWRRTYIPQGSFSVTEMPNEIAQNKMFMQGFDKKGRPIAILFGGRHFQHKGGLEEFKRFAVYSLDKICSRMPPGQEKFTVIGDLQGWGYANSDLRAYLGGLSIFQDYYPERLGKMLIVHAPYLFLTVWKVVYPFIDEKTRNKIVFVEDKKLKASLLEDIDESQLPETYGGKLKLVPIQQS